MKRLLSLCLVALLSCVAVAGDHAGNGGDNPTWDSGAAWFVGDGPIHYCYQIDPSFGVSEGDVQSAISAAFQTWAAYLQKKQVSYVLGNDTYHFSTDARSLGQCATLSSPGAADLIFNLGTSSAEINKAKALYQNPTSFAYRTSYDPAKGWGGGFIWVASRGGVVGPDILPGFPDWTKPNLLESTLLHELGHVYGCPHRDGTIMDANISLVLEQATTASEPWSWITHVDWSRELTFVPSTASVTLPGILVGPSTAETFRRFSGRAPQGEIGATVNWNESGASSVALSDQIGTATIPFMAGAPIQTSEDLALFKIYVETKATGNVIPIGVTSRSALAEVRFGQVKDPQGNSYMLEFDRNMGAHPMEIRYFANGNLLPLFFADNLQMTHRAAP